MKKMGLYWWGFRRIWFMPMEKMEVITEEMAKRFFRGGGKADREKHQENEGRAGMGGNTFANGARILAFSNDEITDTTEICDNPYAEVEWIA